MTKVNIRFADNVQVTVNATVKIDEENDTIDIVLGKLDRSPDKITLGYNLNYSNAHHRKRKISDEMLHQVAELLQQGLSNRTIANKLGLSIENVYNVRIAKATRYRKLYEEVGGWPAGVQRGTYKVRREL